MKRTRAYKNYPSWRQRDMRSLLLSLSIGAIAAAVAGTLIYFSNRGH
jgi:hypothetical protein